MIDGGLCALLSSRAPEGVYPRLYMVVQQPLNSEFSPPVECIWSQNVRQNVTGAVLFLLPSSSSLKDTMHWPYLVTGLFVSILLLYLRVVGF